MSEIDGPSNISPHTGEGATRVTRPSSTSDDSSAQQQSTEQKASTPDKTQKNIEKPASHETAVTISTNLSNLEAGNRISTNYLGIDGEDRPLIASNEGTYVVKYDAVHQQDIDKIPQGATLDVKILKVEREIEARLILPDPATGKAPSPPISIPVTLELIGLGVNPPRVNIPTDQSQLPIDQLRIPYKATDLYQAENTTRESAIKLKELPLTTTTTNYTLFEKAVPQHNRPVIIRSVVTENILLAQEQTTLKTSSATAEKLTVPVKTNLLTKNIEKLLHRNTLATVIKNIPKLDVKDLKLPEMVRNQLGIIGPLDNLKAGQNLTLRINSIAVPDARPHAEDNISPKNFLTPPAETSHIKTVEKATTPPQTVQPQAMNQTEPNKDPLAATQILSGIIIAPGKDTPYTAPKKSGVPFMSKLNSRYPDHHTPNETSQKNTLKTLYIATPVSILKFQSPIDLAPGTIINFSLLDSSDTKTSRQEDISKTPAQTSQNSPATNWVATSAITRTDLAQPSTLEIPLQPLGSLIQNWQSLSQILSVLPITDGTNLIQVLNNRIPGTQNPGQMTTTMVFFLAAMGANSPARIWLGSEITQRLEKSGQGKLLNMLDHDMQRIFRLGAESPANEWRPALIPLQVSGDISAFPILVRHISDEDQERKNDADDEEENAKITATRFIVEIDLSQLGQLQVDGLLKEKKLNIIIRSKIILPPEMKKRMIGMFTTALEISGYNGDLQFKDNVRPDISVQDIINQKIHMFRT
ncbi:MAG: hypothetical protein JKY45_14260 [Emcibacter sp.]|nr:hypothetical protein [Emcibacter sp.]